MVLLHASLFIILTAVKRLPEHVQVDDPAALRKLAKKLERQQVGGGLDNRLHATGSHATGLCGVGQAHAWWGVGLGLCWAEETSGVLPISTGCDRWF